MKQISNTLLNSLVSRKCMQNFNKIIELYDSWSSIFHTKYLFLKNKSLKLFESPSSYIYSWVILYLNLYTKGYFKVTSI